LDIYPLAVAFSVDTLTNWLTVAIGLGLVIFFHELGHFAVAKWCDVNVERFSIGFGPILLSRKWGETEYALSAIPFGGYVKMLGQDDADPSQLTNEEIAQDPRSYTAKTVPQRMAIISAGVTMNIITGLGFFAIAFLSGVERPDRHVGYVQVGKPAWESGMQPGDEILEINGKRIDDFLDVMRNIALSDGAIEVRGVHLDGTKYTATIEPVNPGESTTRRQIGVAPTYALTIGKFVDSDRAAIVPGSPAASAGFQAGDLVRRVGDTEVSRYAELEAIFSASAGDDLNVFVARKGEADLVQVVLPKQPFRTLGLQMDIGKVVAVRPGSPGDEAQLKVGDKIIQVDGQAVGSDIDPMELPEAVQQRAGSEITLTISREVEKSEPVTLDITLVPDRDVTWREEPATGPSPLSIASIGVAYQLIPAVYSVTQDSPADKAGIESKDSVTEVEFILREDAPKKDYPERTVKIPIGDDNSWAHVMWSLQRLPVASVNLTVRPANSDDTKVLELVPAEDGSRFVAGDRGLLFEPRMVELKATTFGESIAMGWRYTTNSITDIYLTLRALVTGRISPKELHGPIGIVELASSQAEMGLAHFVLFLGLISVNLAVINFLPIPVLDGGHMVFLLWEAAIRRKPNEKVVAAATYCGLAFVLGLMVIVIWLDLSK